MRLFLMHFCFIGLDFPSGSFVRHVSSLLWMQLIFTCSYGPPCLPEQHNMQLSVFLRCVHTWCYLCTKWGVVWLVGFWTFSSTTRLYRGRFPGLKSDNFTCCHTWDGARRPWLLSQLVIIVLTPTQGEWSFILFLIWMNTFSHRLKVPRYTYHNKRISLYSTWSFYSPDCPIIRGALYLSFSNYRRMVYIPQESLSSLSPFSRSSLSHSASLLDAYLSPVNLYTNSLSQVHQR